MIEYDETTAAQPATGIEEDVLSGDDDRTCWVCTSPVIRRHCKIICPRCGFTRDCSDP